MGDYVKNGYLIDESLVWARSFYVKTSSIDRNN